MLVGNRTSGSNIGLKENPGVKDDTSDTVRQAGCMGTATLVRSFSAPDEGL